MIKYREIIGYRYQLYEEDFVTTDITGHSIETEFLRLTIDGDLIARKNYCWNGASGYFTIQTKTNKRGSLYHDALYQLIRMRLLPVHIKVDADQLLQEICLADKMLPFRAWYFYHAVSMFGHGSCTPGTQKVRPVLEAP